MRIGVCATAVGETPAAAQMTASAIANAKLPLYEGCGHAPFHEDAFRFNRELKTFVAQTWRG